MILIRVPLIDFIWFAVIDRLHLIRVSLIFLTDSLSDLDAVDQLCLIRMSSTDYIWFRFYRSTVGFIDQFYYKHYRMCYFLMDFFLQKILWYVFVLVKSLKDRVGSLITLTKQKYSDLKTGDNYVINDPIFFAWKLSNSVCRVFTKKSWRKRKR